MSRHNGMLGTGDRTQSYVYTRNTQLLAEPVYSRLELGSKRRLPSSTKADGAQGKKKQLTTGGQMRR